MMPSKRIHELIDITIFGSSYPEIHYHKDSPITELGILHRIVRHDPLYTLHSKHPAVSFTHDLVDLLTLPLVPAVYVLCPELVVD